MIDSFLLQNIQGYINGCWIGEISSSAIEVRNPATGELLARVPSLTNDEIERSVECADRAWQEMFAIDERKEWLSQIAALILENKTELGRIVSMEHGKPWKEAILEAEYAANFFRYYADCIECLKPRVVSDNLRNHRWTVYSRPVGVAALISPWNFPLAMMAKKMSAALAAGCACIAKPSSKTPLSMIALFSLIDSLGLPKGLANLVIGSSAEISLVFCKHPLVRVVSFTGSTEVGRQLMSSCAPFLKRLSLELGGNAPFIVFEDADVAESVAALVMNKFRGAGQTCVCPNRVYIHANIADEFTKRLLERVSQLKLGNGLDSETDLGPLIDLKALAKVERHVKDAVAQGAQCVVGGRETTPLGCDESAPFFRPTVLRGVTSRMACVREETFGPLIPLIEFHGEEEVVQAANDTEYGLAAYVFTSDSGKAQRVLSRLRFGHVGLNTGAGPTAEAPFGGMKQSGFGREGGVEGLHDFIEYQTVPSKLG